MNIENENNGDEEKMELCLANLRKKIEGSDHLNNISTTNRYLSRFVYSSEYDVDKAFDWLKAYHAHIKDCPQFYPKIGPLDIKPLIERQISTVLLNCDREGRPIFICKPANINTNNTTLLQLAELDDIWFEHILINEPRIAAKGLCYIIDIKNHSYGFIKWFNVTNIKRGIGKIANLPFKEFVLHVVNKSLPILALAKIAMPLMPESSKKQVKFHFNDWHSLHQHIDPKYLPKEYGGTTEIDYASIYRKLYESHEKILQSFESARSNKIE